MGRLKRSTGVLTRSCARCFGAFPRDAFYRCRSTHDGLSSWCKPCFLENKRAWRINTSKGRLEDAKAKIALRKVNSRRAKLVRAMKNTVCVDCGEKYPYFVMDFDHRDPSQKRFGICDAGTSKGELELAEEIAKCDVVCANCHRYRTQFRQLIAA